MRTATTYPAEKFDFSHVEKILERCVRQNDCFVWAGATTKRRMGYGRIMIANKAWCVHRVVWTVLVGEIQEQKIIMHSCDNPLCCNVAHMSVGDQTENVKDMIRKKRKVTNTTKGSSSVNAKINEDDAKWIIENHKRFDPVYGTSPLANRFGIGASQVSRIVSGKRWAHVKR